jgi:fibronectin type 3 domain-containing protein
VTSLLATVATLAAAPTASASFSAVGPLDAKTNFPAWYSDSNGLALDLCIDGPPYCLGEPTLVQDHADGLDAEAFYFAADSTAGPFDLHLALEAAYAADGPDQEVTFQRTQVSTDGGGGVLGNSTYRVTDPYGTYTCTTEAGGAIPNNGCRTETTPVERDFNRALTGRLGPFLTAAPGAVPAPPPGHIGDNVTPVPVTGSPTGFNKFRVTGPGLTGTCTNDDGTTVSNCVESSRFILQGKVAPGQSASTDVAALDYGNVAAPVKKTITYRSTGSEAVTVSGVTLGGTDAADFALAENCTTAGGAAAPGVAPGTSCTIDVTYTPREGFASTATVTIADSTTGSPRTITLKGSSLGVSTKDRASMAFATQKVGTTSASDVVTIGNDGVAPLTVGTPSITGTSAGHFKVATNGCTTPVAPTGGCEIAVAFAPTSGGSKTATLNIPTNGGNQAVALSGTGVTPVISVTPATLALSFANQDAGTSSAPKAVTFTNGGTAAFSVDDIAFTGNFKRDGGTCLVGNTVAPGSSCSVNVAFAPTSAGLKEGTLTVSTDGVVNTINLSGTGVAPADIVSPSTPTGLSATGSSGSQIRLTWNASTDNVGVVRYDVYRDGGIAPVGSSSTTSFTDGALGEFTQHSYTVKAVDAANNASGASVSATARTLDVTAPSLPTGVAATGASTTSITVRWTASTDNVGVTGYRVYADGATTPTATVITGTSYTHTALVTGSTHSYRVSAIDAAGNESAQTTAVSGTTTAAPVDPVPTVTARSPLSGATGVSATGNVTATFSEAVQGVSGTTFTLRPTSGTTPVTATVTYDAATRVATLDPSATLAAGTSYTATLTGGATAIRDSANQALGNTSWAFTTAAATTGGTRTVVLNPVADVTASQLTPTTTAGGATSLKVDQEATDGNLNSRATSYLRFTVPALATGESITAANLSLQVTNATTNGPAIWRTGTTWSESTLTYNTGQPARSGTAAVGNFANMAIGRVGTPVSGITGAGDVSFQLFAEAIDGLDFASRENTTTTNRPQLTLTIRTP